MNPPAGLIGTPEFYLWLYHETAPGYDHTWRFEYLGGWGYYFAQKFQKLIDSDDLSEEEKEVTRRVMRLLQERLLLAINQDPSLLSDAARLRGAAFLSHGPAYREGGVWSHPGLWLDYLGIAGLPAIDNWDWAVFGERRPFVFF